jgi:hypothetical protein
MQCRRIISEKHRYWNINGLRFWGEPEVLRFKPAQPHGLWWHE